MALNQAKARRRIARVLESGHIEGLRRLGRVPSVSVGVVHEGELVAAQSFGHSNPQDVASAPPDAETLYTLCSISKTFVSAALGILVDEGKLAWTDPVGRYLPEFAPRGDAHIAAEATFNDFLRHSSGITNPVVTVFGPGGRLIVPPRDFIAVVNDAPTGYRGDPYFNRTWVYSNIAYGLLTLVVERLTGVPYAHFLQDRILRPLGMLHTALTADRVATGSGAKVAYAYAQMEDGSWEPLEHEWTSEAHSPALGMVGVRSSVRDMLIFSAAVMQAFSPVASHDVSAFKVLEHVRENPLRQMGAILDDYYWTRPHDDPFGHEARYHLGWMKVVMPSCMVSWGSWNGTLADNAGPEHRKFRDAHILGARSAGTRLLYKSTGIGFCGTGSVNLFPETRSAVVVFANGLNCVDVADFSASLLIQALFDLRPPVDIIAVAKREARVRLAEFDDVMQDLRQHRDVSRPERDHAEYVGRYHGLGIDLVIRDKSGGMQLCLNHRDDLVLPLEHYNVDQYSFWPKTRDDWLRGGWLDWDYYLVGILTFKRDDAGAVHGLNWLWEKPAEPFFFFKVKDDASSSQLSFLSPS